MIQQESVNRYHGLEEVVAEEAHGKTHTLTPEEIILRVERERREEAVKMASNTEQSEMR